jgi:hypothetical protein
MLNPIYIRKPKIPRVLAEAKQLLKRRLEMVANKIAERLNGWSFRWLSKANRLTLTKSVLEVISVYWMSLAWIPKGVLEIIRRTCSRFIWSELGDKFPQPWVKWEHIARPKALGGWGLKKKFLFSKALVTKACCRLISMTILWTLLVTQKYIFLDTMEDWIHSPIKITCNCSIVWKAMISSFSMVWEGMS